MNPPLRVLVVCTGNLCRSPLAGAMLERAARERGLPLEVRTRGLAAVSGALPPEETLAAALALGLDLSGHRGRQLDLEDLDWADRILVMEPWQKEALRELRRGKGSVEGLWEWAPGAPAEIPDPYGDPAEGHVQAARLLEAALEAWLAGR